MRVSGPRPIDRRLLISSSSLCPICTSPKAWGRLIHAEPPIFPRSILRIPQCLSKTWNMLTNFCICTIRLDEWWLPLREQPPEFQSWGAKWRQPLAAAKRNYRPRPEKSDLAYFSFGASEAIARPFGVTLSTWYAGPVAYRPFITGTSSFLYKPGFAGIFSIDPIYLLSSTSITAEIFTVFFFYALFQ